MIAQELGVRYLLEGSVRRAGERIRVTVQLRDAISEVQVWAERYDRRITDIFDLQDEITEQVCATIGPEITRAEIDRADRKRPGTLDAWDHYLRALRLMNQINKESLIQAEEQLFKVCEMDPKFAGGYAGLAWCHSLNAFSGWSESGRRSRAEAMRCARQAVALDPDDPMANVYLSWVYIHAGQQHQAIDTARRALELDPNSSQAFGFLGMALALAGRRDEAISASERALRGSPRDPLRSHFYSAISNALFMQGEYEDAITWSRRATQLQQSYFGWYLILAAGAAHLGRDGEARLAAEEILRLVPRLTLKGIRKNPMFTEPADIERLVAGLRKAGLPE